MKRILITTILFSLFFCSKAQNINGIWRGKLVMEPGGCFPVYNMELQIQESGGKIIGTSYHFSDTTNYVREVFEGVYDSAAGSMIIEEQRVATFHIPADCIPCIKRYSLSFHKNDKDEQLRGSWTGKTMDNKNTCPPGTIVLNRIMASEFKQAPPPILELRKNELVKEIYVDTGNIKLDFYDNGQIDGDTISVFVNGIAVVSRQMLTAKPVTTYVRIDMITQQQEIIMVAENLGSIPPNTALMLLTAGNKRYQLFLASDNNKNAMVRLIYEKPK